MSLSPYKPRRDMLQLLMRPSNAVCDAIGITDEGERGVVRMLVNMLLLSLVFFLIFVGAVAAF
jgi:hypothetical protein